MEHFPIFKLLQLVHSVTEALRQMFWFWLATQVMFAHHFQDTDWKNKCDKKIFL